MPNQAALYPALEHRSTACGRCFINVIQNIWSPDNYSTPTQGGVVSVRVRRPRLRGPGFGSARLYKMISFTHCRVYEDSPRAVYMISGALSRNKRSSRRQDEPSKDTATIKTFPASLMGFGQLTYRRQTKRI